MPTSNASTDAFAAGLLLWFENHAAQGLFTTDCALNIRTWNRWLATATGLAADEVIGRSILDVMPSLVERGLDAHYREALGARRRSSRTPCIATCCRARSPTAR